LQNRNAVSLHKQRRGLMW